MTVGRINDQQNIMCNEKINFKEIANIANN